MPVCTPTYMIIHRNVLYNELYDHIDISCYPDKHMPLDNQYTTSVYFISHLCNFSEEYDMNESLSTICMLYARRVK